jgi:pimeloyl-ACP methyl ester carboxylesterase
VLFTLAALARPRKIYVMRWLRFVLGLGTLFSARLLLAAEAADGEVQMSQWNGYRRSDFVVAGRPCLVVEPAQAAAGKPWIWRTEFFGTEPQADVALLARGWHVAYMNAKNLYGGPEAMRLFEAFYAHAVGKLGLAKRVVLEGFSRGGLYAFNFAAAHPERAAALYLDAPVLDMRSWPGHKRASKEWRECLAVYGLKDDMPADFAANPVNEIDTLAAAKIPILAVCGDADKIVPLSENTAVLEKRYRELGAPIEVILKPGGDHHPHSLKDPKPIVDFLLKNAKF